MATLLILTTMLPLIGSLILGFSPGMDARAARWLAMATALATLGLSLVLLAAFNVGMVEPQFTIGRPGAYGFSWIARPDIRFALGLDGISLWLYVLTSLLMITAISASWDSIKEQIPRHFCLLLALQTGLLGLFSSLDVVVFYIFFEFTLIPLFFLIGFYGGTERRRASVTFFLYTLAGSLLTLVGVVALVVLHFQHTGNLTFSIPGLTQGLAAMEWSPWSQVTPWHQSPQVLIFLLLFAGFAIKVPLFPFHTWLPLAHVEAPTAGSILLAGVMLKVGGYGFLRFNIGMTPLGANALAPFMLTLSVIGILYGALAALAQSDMKRLVAYSSVSHMGFIALGLFSLNGVGVEGAVMQMVNHGLTTGALFACVGIVYERYHTREMGEMSGLWIRSPLFAFFLIFASLGSAALPGLNGFVGEFPILIGTYASNPMAATFASVGMVLGAYYLLAMIQKVVFGPLKEPGGHTHGDDSHGHSEIKPITLIEIIGLTPLLFLILYIGLNPSPFYRRISPSVTALVKRVDTAKAGPPDTTPQQTQSLRISTDARGTSRD